MLTIFEGADCAGKTTLIETLRKTRRGRVIHHGAYAGERQIAHHYLASLNASFVAPVLMDRSWLAEPIYGAAFRNGVERIGVATRRMLERVALSRSACVVRCAPPFERCAEAFAKRKGLEYLDNVEQLRAVYLGYHAMTTQLPMVDYDYTTDDVETMWARATAARSPKNLGPGIGHWAERGGVTLLVGAQMNAPESAHDLPFVSFNGGGCSAWLAEGLESAGIPETSLYWVNALTPDGGVTKADFVDELRPRRTIALGADAAAWCVAAGIAHSTTQHPQFWRRFRSQEDYPLLAMLQEVL